MASTAPEPVPIVTAQTRLRAAVTAAGGPAHAAARLACTPAAIHRIIQHGGPSLTLALAIQREYGIPCAEWGGTGKRRGGR